MTSPLVKLSRRIYSQLDDVEEVVSRAQEGWQEYKSTNNDLYLDSVALSLHGFYSGVESLLQEIATGLDRHLPTGREWHKELLQQMANAIPSVRPAVISTSTTNALDEYCRFRHVVRNVYNYRLKSEKIEPLVNGLRSAFKQVRQELIDFVRWLSEFS